MFSTNEKKSSFTGNIFSEKGILVKNGQSEEQKNTFKEYPLKSNSWKRRYNIKYRLLNSMFMETQTKISIKVVC
jgi:hypothetical protein